MTKKQTIEKIDLLIEEYKKELQDYNNLYSTYLRENDVQVYSEYIGKISEVESFIRELKNLKKEI